MTGVISAVIRFREWPALCGEMCVCGAGKGGGEESAWLTPYHSQDILYMSGQLRWKIELTHACAIEQVASAGRSAPRDEYAEKSGRSYAGERSLHVSNLRTPFEVLCTV